jgi:hypothetical protein
MHLNCSWSPIARLRDTSTRDRVGQGVLLRRPPRELPRWVKDKGPRYAQVFIFREARKIETKGHLSSERREFCCVQFTSKTRAYAQALKSPGVPPAAKNKAILRRANLNRRINVSASIAEAAA